MAYKKLPRKGTKEEFIKNNIAAIRKRSGAAVTEKETSNPLSTGNIIKGAAKGTARDIVKFTTGRGKGGAATEVVRKIGTSTGYMLGRIRGALKKGGKAMIKRGVAPKKDYTKWKENIRRGKAGENLK